MTLRKLFLTGLAGIALSTSAAVAAPDCARDRDGCRNEQRHDERNDPRHDGAMGNAMRGAMGNAMHSDMHGDNRGNHDRYWRPEYHGFVAQDRVFAALRGRGYARFNGAPYWFQGRYVVKSFDRYGRPIFIEINPYTGAFIGVVRF